MSNKQRLIVKTILKNRYVVGSVLGQGGFGITYEGKDRITGERVAIKEFFCRDYMQRNVACSDEVVLSDASVMERMEADRKNFQNEAMVLKSLTNTDGLVRVKDYFEENGTAYIVMDYLDGITLRTYVEQKERLGAEETFLRMEPIMKSLALIHEKGLIHRDISPDNIMVLSNGSFCLIDFGAALPEGRKAAGYNLVGKNGYTPYEQHFGESDIRPCADIYSLCATIYYCVTGLDPEDALQRILFDELQMPKDLGVQMNDVYEEILYKGMRVEPQDRWQHLDEILQKLEEDRLSRKEQERKAKAKKVHRSIILAAILVAAAVVCIILVRRDYLSKHNDSYQTAFEMKLNESMPGAINSLNDTDYYKAMMQEDGTLELLFEHAYKEVPDEQTSAGWEVILYKEEGGQQKQIEAASVYQDDNEKKVVFEIEENSGDLYYFTVRGLSEEVLKEDYSLKIVYPAKKIKLDPEKLNLEINAKTKLEVVVTPASAQPELIFSSSDPEVVFVEEDGTVSALRYGKAVISVSVKDNRKVKSKCTIRTRFYDLADSSSPFYKAVYWAADQNIAAGYDGAYFGAKQQIRRREFSIMLYRFLGQPDISEYADFSDVKRNEKSEGYKAISCMAEQGLIDPVGQGLFAPEEPVTRGEVALALYRIAGRPQIFGESSFADVTAYEGAEEARNALLWAEQQKIAGGFADGTMRPDEACMRGSAVLMLYRYHLAEEKK